MKPNRFITLLITLILVSCASMIQKGEDVARTAVADMETDTRPSFLLVTHAPNPSPTPTPFQPAEGHMGVDTQCATTEGFSTPEVSVICPPDPNAPTPDMIPRVSHHLLCDGHFAEPAGKYILTGSDKGVPYFGDGESVNFLENGTVITMLWNVVHDEEWYSRVQLTDGTIVLLANSANEVSCTRAD